VLWSGIVFVLLTASLGPHIAHIAVLLMQCAHIMAMAVQRLHKDAQVTIGPWIDRGFYYDFDLDTPLSEKELKAIRKEMQKIIRMNLPFIREEVRGLQLGWRGAMGRGRLAEAGQEGCGVVHQAAVGGQV
jgi:hypothetical protein